MRLRGANVCDQVVYSCGRTMKIVEYEWESSLVRIILFYYKHLLSESATICSLSTIAD